MIVNYTIENFLSIKEPQTISFWVNSPIALSSSFCRNEGEVPECELFKCGDDFYLYKSLFLIGYDYKKVDELLRAINYIPKIFNENNGKFVSLPWFVQSPRIASITIDFIVQPYDRRIYRYILKFNQDVIIHEELNYEDFTTEEITLIYSRIYQENSQDYIYNVDYLNIDDENLNYIKKCLSSKQLLLFNLNRCLNFNKIHHLLFLNCVNVLTNCEKMKHYYLDELKYNSIYKMFICENDFISKMHFLEANKMINEFCYNNNHYQSLLASTNPLFLDNDRYFRKGQIYFVNEKNNQSEIYSLAYFKLAELDKKNANYVDAYLRDKFGAVPEVY